MEVVWLGCWSCYAEVPVQTLAGWMSVQIPPFGIIKFHLTYLFDYSVSLVSIVVLNTLITLNSYFVSILLVFYLECDFSFVILSASKPWVCFGNMFLKLPSSNVQAMLQQGRCKWWELRKLLTIIELFQTYRSSMMSYLCQKCKTMRVTNFISEIKLKKNSLILKIWCRSTTQNYYQGFILKCQHM